MTPIVTHSQVKLATRLAFIAAGFAVACWAPLVPYAKAGCQLNDGTMGLILLLLARDHFDCFRLQLRGSDRKRGVPGLQCCCKAFSGLPSHVIMWR